MIIDRDGARTLPAPAGSGRDPTAPPASQRLLDAAFGWMTAVGGHGDPNRKV